MIITKLEAARRQLTTALELWMSEGDPVAVHTLAHAAHEIIHRCFRNAGHSDLLYDSTLIEEEHRADFARFMKDDANFFKHSNNEKATDTRDFNPEGNLPFLLMSVLALDAMSEPRGDAENAFMMWHFINRPTWFRK